MDTSEDDEITRSTDTASWLRGKSLLVWDKSIGEFCWSLPAIEAEANAKHQSVNIFNKKFKDLYLLIGLDGCPTGDEGVDGGIYDSFILKSEM